MARASAFIRSSLVPVDRGQRSHPCPVVDGVGVTADPDDRDVGEVGELLDVDEALLVQLEHGEEAHDDLETFEQPAGELPERHAPRAWQLVEQLLHRVGDAGADRCDVVEVDAWRRLRRDGAEERGVDVRRCDPGEEIGRDGEEAVLEPRRAGVRPACGGRQPQERARRVLERLALEQAGEKEVALLPQRQLVVEVDVLVTRQKPLRLQLDERRGDEEELGRHLEVEVLHARQLVEVGVDDAGELHLVEVDLFPQDEVEQEVEGPLEDRGLHLVRHRGQG